MAPTHALRFVFADNDVFSDPSSCPRGDRIDPSIHDVRFAAASSMSRDGNSFFRDRVVRRLDGGVRRDRTDDLMLAKHALYQLSYGPFGEVVVMSTWR